GTTRGGDAQLGLVRAFRQAGAEAVLATLWKVVDGSTSAFMDNFYGQLRADASPVTALRSTQLAFLHQAGASPVTALRSTLFAFLHQGAEILIAHPYFWAGYQLTSFATR